MKNSNKKGILFISFIALTILLSSCAKKYDSNEFIKTTSTNNVAIEGNTQTQAPVTDISDKDEKFKLVMDEVHKMEEGAMSKVKETFTDLEFVRQSAKGANDNLVGFGPEDWLYSKTYDITVVVCNSMNTPAYIFDGKTLEGAELEKVKEMMKEMMEMMEEDGMMMMDHEGDMMMGDHEGGMMMDEEEGEHMMMDDESSVKDSKGAYADYSQAAVNNADGKIVLFFHANWCPTCRAIDKDILSKTVPDNLTILKTDFDTETDLRKKYGVTAQTTFVQIDNEGNMIKKWIGGKLEDIVESVGL